LLVDFDEGIRLEVFNNSSGFEGLVLNGPDGRMFVAQGGGKLSEWKADAQIEANRTDWRLQGQERYLKGATLIHREYRRFAENRD